MERLTTERLEFLTLGLADRKRARVQGHVGGQSMLASSIAEEQAMARELLELLELRAQAAAQDVQEIPSPPIPTPCRLEREALLSIVRASCEVDTVRKAALALLGEVQP